MNHGRTAYGHGQCRCEVCREAHRVYQAALLARHRAMGVPPGHPHNASTYRQWGCRCDVCREAQSARNRSDYAYRKRVRRGQDEATG